MHQHDEMHVGSLSQLCILQVSPGQQQWWEFKVMLLPCLQQPDF
jgi:hypothetical protein